MTGDPFGNGNEWPDSQVTKGENELVNNNTLRGRGEKTKDVFRVNRSRSQSRLFLIAKSHGMSREAPPDDNGSPGIQSYLRDKLYSKG